MGASEKAEEEAIRKAVDFSTTARCQTVKVNEMVMLRCHLCGSCSRRRARQ